MFPEISRNDITAIDTNQMIEVDRLMMDEYRIDLIQMMENAGRNLAHLARELFFGGNPLGKRVLVMAGSGGNGGGALVAARRLSNWGADVTVALGQELGKMKGVPAHQLFTVQHMGIEGVSAPTPVEYLKQCGFDLILDGLIGYSLKGSPRGLIGQLISYANKTNTPVLSLDTSSGVDTANGTIYDPAIKAAATMTLALPKAGLFVDRVQQQTGELFLADISVPPQLLASIDKSLKKRCIFVENDIVKII